MSAATILLALVVGHALADYPLQGDFLSRAKSRTNPIPGVPWYQAMGAHVVIHGGIVYFITGLWYLAAAEMVVHAITDDAKCAGRISFNIDQSIHLACKIMFAGVFMLVNRP